MLSREDNEKLTRSGPGTPIGEVLRRYWIPALLSEELPGPDCTPVRVRLLSEDLIAFRDSKGKVALIDERCPHRGASLFFGRNEEGGLRCVYHGWKFDVTGACLETPNEPAHSKVGEKVRARVYPCEEMGGVVWAFMGPIEQMTPLQSQEWMRLPQGHLFVTKNLAECNWLQLMEGGFDSSHSSFLHYTRDLENTMSTWTYRVQATAPKLDVKLTDYGYCYASIRSVKDEQQYVRAVQFVMPFHQMRAGEGVSNRPLIDGHIWVPIDDENCWVWSWMHAKDCGPLDGDVIEKAQRRGGRTPEFFVPGTYRMKQNRANDYLIDREAQRKVSFTGITGIGQQDQAAQESMGRIADRTTEHLGISDAAVVSLRRLLLEACADLEKGKNPRGAKLPKIGVRPAEILLPAQSAWHEAMAEALTAEA